MVVCKQQQQQTNKHTNKPKQQEQQQTKKKKKKEKKKKKRETAAAEQEEKKKKEDWYITFQGAETSMDPVNIHEVRSPRELISKTRLRGAQAMVQTTKHLQAFETSAHTRFAIALVTRRDLTR